MKAAEMVKDESWLAEMVKDKSLTESPLSVALNCRKIKREISSTWLVNNVKNKYQRSSTGLENFGLCWKVTYKNCCFQSKQSSACIEEMSLVGWSLIYRMFNIFIPYWILYCFGGPSKHKCQIVRSGLLVRTRSCWQTAWGWSRLVSTMNIE